MRNECIDNVEKMLFSMSKVTDLLFAWEKNSYFAI